MGKNPWFAAILNILVIGLGYVGKRTVFGILLIVSYVTGISLLFVFPQYVTREILLHPLNIISILTAYFAFAFDAYNDASRRR